MFLLGRTGRAGNQGDAISFVGPKDWVSFKNVEGFLQQTISFTEVEGLAAKFKGLKPKPKKKPVKAKAKKAAKTEQAPAKAKRINKKTMFTLQDAGDAPVMRRKTEVAPEDIDKQDEEA